MDSIEIRAALARLGWTQADIAAKASIAASTISLVISQRARSRKAEVAIAAVLGKALHEVWPNWYCAQGRRLRTKQRTLRADRAAELRLSEALARAA